MAGRDATKPTPGEKTRKYPGRRKSPKMMERFKNKIEDKEDEKSSPIRKAQPRKRGKRLLTPPVETKTKSSQSRAGGIKQYAVTDEVLLFILGRACT